MFNTCVDMAPHMYKYVDLCTAGLTFAVKLFSKPTKPTKQLLQLRRMLIRVINMHTGDTTGEFITFALCQQSSSACSITKATLWQGSHTLPTLPQQLPRASLQAVLTPWPDCQHARGMHIKTMQGLKLFDLRRQGLKTSCLTMANMVLTSCCHQ